MHRISMTMDPELPTATWLCSASQKTRQWVSCVGLCILNRACVCVDVSQPKSVFDAGYKGVAVLSGPCQTV